MRSIAEHPDLGLQLVVAGTMVLARFGEPSEVVRKDGFRVDGEIYLELEGSTPTTMAKSVGFGMVEFASEFQRLKPDTVLVIGDRYEALAAAIAAAYMNICVAHVQGGEVSGSIDESARHAITKFAHYHFPSTVRAAEYLVRMGEAPWSILSIGCPSSDIAFGLDGKLEPEMVNGTGGGSWINTDEPYLLVVYHPTTTAYGKERQEIDALLSALDALRMQTVLLWPNIDAGSDQISKRIRVFRDRKGPKWLRTVTNLSPETYLRVLAGAACAVGNSSSFVRDAGYFGTPVVLLGERQHGREHDDHVVLGELVPSQIMRRIREQLVRGRYAPSTLYGDGQVSQRIANGLAAARLYLQKQLFYINEVANECAISAPGVGDELASVGDRAGTRGIEGNPS